MFQNPVVVIAILLAAAVFGGMIAHRLRQPVILGYLVIGVAIGPNALGLVGDRALVEVAATVGVALLMFTLGLETSFSQLRQTGKAGLLGGVVQVVATFVVGLLAGAIIFRWSLPQAALFGLVISLSSTAVCFKMLMERGELDSVHGRIMIAILILQDVAVVVMTVVVPLLGTGLGALPGALALAAGKAILFTAIAIVLGLWVLPWVLGRIGRVKTRELFLMTVLGLCLGAALGTEIIGLPAVFGAFLIGLVLHESRFAHHALAEITPLRDIFATLFFMSLGMLFDPAFLVDNWALVLVTVSTIVVIKFGVVYGVVRAFGYGNRVATMTGASLFQIGEFGFILAQMGNQFDLVTEQFYSLMLASSILTMLLTPFSMNLVGRLYGPPLPLMRSRQPRAGRPTDKPGESGHVVIAGYGRIGQNMAQGLQDAAIGFTIIDIDSERISAARTDGRHCLHGDASNPAVLAAAGIPEVGVLAVTFPDPVAVINTVRTALDMNPGLKVVARVHRSREAQSLEGLRGVELVSPEYEASLEFVKRILKVSGWKQPDIERTIPKLERDAKFVEFAADDEH
jgi:CPA2 family monovalent cation:H+ antiporter-2